MALVTVGQFAMVSGTIRLPRVGAWWMDCEVATDEPVTGTVIVASELGLSLKGTVHRGRVSNHKQELRIVGGADGLQKLVEPKHYSVPSVGTVLSDILAGAGETLSATTDAALLGTRLDNWTTVPIPAGKAISDLVAHCPAGTVWRVLPDGTVWLGAETWPVADSEEIRSLSDDDSAGSVELGMAAPTLLPGATLNGRKLDYVEHRVESGTLRTTVWLLDETMGDESSRMHDPVAARVRAKLPTPHYFGVYPFQLVKQTGFLVEGLPQVEGLPPMSNVPLHVGVPGLEMQVSPGATILIGWQGGDPERPYAALWNKEATVASLTMNTLQTKLGGPGATEPLIKGNAFNAIWAAHVHPTPFGPTSPTPLPLLPALSLKHFLDS